MSEVKLVIPRQPYGNLQRPGAGRVGDVRLSPEGMAALERLTTCSRGAVLDLAVQVLDAVANGDADRLDMVTISLAIATVDGDDCPSIASNLGRLAWRLARDKVKPPDESQP